MMMMMMKFFFPPLKKKERKNMGASFSSTTTPREKAISNMVSTYMKERVCRSSLPLDGADRVEAQVIHNLLHRLLASDACIEVLGKEIHLRLEILPGKAERAAKEKDDEEYWDAIERFPAS